MERHLTVSGFVVHDGRVALHWHRRNEMWLPAGGHLEAGEDPVEATLREVREEFEVEAEIVALAPRIGYPGRPEQVEPPFTILICPVENCSRSGGGPAVHFDMVYFLRLTSGYPGKSYDLDSPIHWFTAEELAAGTAPRGGADVAFPPDVQALGIEAIRLAASIAAGAR